MVKKLKGSGTVLKKVTRSTGKTRNCLNFKQKLKIIEADIFLAIFMKEPHQNKAINLKTGKKIK